MAMFRHLSGLGVELASPQNAAHWVEHCQFGPLHYSTRLAWPEQRTLTRKIVAFACLTAR